jgi:hypothetical protein
MWGDIRICRDLEMVTTPKPAVCTGRSSWRPGKRRPSRRGRARGTSANISANILTIVRQAEGAELSPGEIQEILADYNIHADLSAIRQALRRWAERHMIIKSGHRYHALARDQVGRPS